MFVRNNTTCPNCGNCKTFDLTISQSDASELWCMRVECIHCSWAMSVDLSSTFLHMVLDRLYESTSTMNGDFKTMDLRLRASTSPDESEPYTVGLSFKKSVDEREFILHVISKFIRKNTIVSEWVHGTIWSDVVEYFVSRPSRKYRVREQSLLRTVGL